MFKNKYLERNNKCGKAVYELRKTKGTDFSQRKLAEMMQIEGIDLDKNAIQRIESGQRFVTDIELAALAKIFKVSTDYLIGRTDNR